MSGHNILGSVHNSLPSQLLRRMLERLAEAMQTVSFVLSGDGDGEEERFAKQHNKLVLIDAPPLETERAGVQQAEQFQHNPGRGFLPEQKQKQKQEAEAGEPESVSGVCPASQR